MRSLGAIIFRNLKLAASSGTTKLIQKSRPWKNWEAKIFVSDNPMSDAVMQRDLYPIHEARRSLAWDNYFVKFEALDSNVVDSRIDAEVKNCEGVRFVFEPRWLTLTRWEMIFAWCKVFFLDESQRLCFSMCRWPKKRRGREREVRKIHGGEQRASLSE